MAISEYCSLEVQLEFCINLRLMDLCYLYINSSEQLVVCTSVAAVWTHQLRAASHGRPSDSFSSLWAAFTLTTYINAL